MTTLSDIDELSVHKQAILGMAKATLTLGRYKFKYKFDPLMHGPPINAIFAALNTPEYMGANCTLTYEPTQNCRGCSSDYGCKCDLSLIDEIAVTINKHY